MMNVFTLLSVCHQILSSGTDVSAGNLGQLSFDVKCKAAKLLNVHRSSGFDVFANIFDQGLPNNNHLCFGLEWFQVRCSSGGRMVMLSRVLIAVLEDPLFQ